jgi:UDP-N-acetylmuramyl pentapeptide phosphotransferase/UDP-N-acetylglucosamine-1-phosphate transferase
MRYALARPNVRSSHRVPTPQGGGIAVIAALTIAAACGPLLLPEIAEAVPSLTVLIAAAIGLAIVGVADDLRPLDALPRLILQIVAVAIVIAMLPAALRVLPFVPWWAERALMLLAGVWLVNLVNFMDGIDWMTVAEVVPVTAGLTMAAALGALPPEAAMIEVALCGAMLGFAPFNKPVARLFLGDVGSLPIGLLLFWLLVTLAGNGHLAAALLLPLYYITDATITLFRRLVAGEKISQAHRRHFYQRALDGGLPVMTIVARIMLTNVALIVLALTTMLYPSHLIDALALLAGCAIVGVLCYRFERSI